MYTLFYNHITCRRNSSLFATTIIIFLFHWHYSKIVTALNISKILGRFETVESQELSGISIATVALQFRFASFLPQSWTLYKEGFNNKTFYERRDYEAIADCSLSSVIVQESASNIQSGS